jgi:hypothetical protein
VYAEHDDAGGRIQPEKPTSKLEAGDAWQVDIDKADIWRIGR